MAILKASSVARLFLVLGVFEVIGLESSPALAIRSARDDFGGLDRASSSVLRSLLKGHTSPNEAQQPSPQAGNQMSSSSSSSSLPPSNVNLSPNLDLDLTKLAIRPGLVRFSSSKPRPTMALRSSSSDRRTKRGRSSQQQNVHYAEMVQDVCPSVSDWVAKTEALDPYGNSVTVVQRIPINGTVVNQYFYETYCASNLKYEYDDFFGTTYRRVTDLQCRGVDKKAWNSRCRENFIWTYGKVTTSGGDNGWSVIAIRGSCGCTIWPKRPDLNHNSVVPGAGRGRRVTTKSSNSVFEADDHSNSNQIFGPQNDPFFR